MTMQTLEAHKSISLPGKEHKTVKKHLATPLVATRMTFTSGGNFSYTTH